jgi:hypothetical protein
VSLHFDAEAIALLAALRAAGCHVYLDDDQVFCSPPCRRVEWHADVEQALEEHHDALRDFLFVGTETVH